jgi:hypothetical protein
MEGDRAADDKGHIIHRPAHERFGINSGRRR